MSIFIGTFADFQKHRIRKALIISFTKVLLYSGVLLILLYGHFSITSVILICLINFISDSFGLFSGKMTVAIYTKIIKDDIVEALGFVQASNTVMHILGNLIGGILIGVISIESIASINVLTFLFAFIGLFFIRRNMERYEAELTVNKEFSGKNFWKHMIDSVKSLLKMQFVIKLIGTSMIVSVILNALSSILPLVFIAFTIKGMNVAQLLSINTISVTLGMLLGNFLSPYVLKKTSLKTFVLFSQLFTVFILVGIVFHNIPLILFGGFVIALIIGLKSPRFRALVLKSIPEESMGAIESAISLIDITLPGLLTLAIIFLAT